MANMRRYFVLLAGFALVTAMSTAQACSSSNPPPTREQSFAQASTVFTAHLLRTEEVDLATPPGEPPGPVVEAAFRTIEVFKGTPPEDGKVMSPVYGPGNCSVPLLAGSDYLFFLSDNSFVWIYSGSDMFWNIEGTEPKKVLGELRELAKKAP